MARELRAVEYAVAGTACGGTELEAGDRRHVGFEAGQIENGRGELVPC